MNAQNRIEKQIFLKADISRVWRAITDHRQFGEWFGVELDSPFAEGRAIKARFSKPFDEAKIQAYQKELGVTPSKIRVPESGITFCTVQRIEPERYFSFRWIPFGIDADIDPENEPTTLVEFRLEPAAGGTTLTITESGFENVPAKRRQRAFLMNDGGWTAQAENVKRYVETI